MKVEKIKIGDHEVEVSKLRTVNIDGNLMPIDLFITIMVVFDRIIGHSTHKVRIDGDTVIIEANVK